MNNKWQHRVDTWSEAVRAQAVLVELRDVGHIDSATCADECTKLYHWAMKETEDKENDDEN
jgi:hypothetical protein